MICACTGNGGDSQIISGTPIPKTPDPGQGGMRGVVENAGELWPNRPVFIFVADFYGDPVGGGAFILEPSIFPKVQLSSEGYFQIMNIPPKEYVLIAGPIAEAGLVLRDTIGNQIFEVVEDQVLDLGSLTITE